jgi:hypothetical protein
MAGEMDGSGGVGSKTDAVRRALETLGADAKPLDIQRFVKEHYDIDISTKVISVYKGKLGRTGRRRGRPGRKPRPEPAAASAPRATAAGEVTMKDLRTIKELSDRVGAGRLRELLELLS